ncbi:MAG: 16S rRNA (uracil(1498)-N(3))-methyltransferase [Clostridiales bacterium]|nr:16S rRNA (uracil(1498)-N(3))-methyltransferase [Clostridiales bacterium]
MVRDFGPVEEFRSMSRFFVDKGQIAAGEVIISAQSDIRHITQALRLKEGDRFEVSDSEQWEYEVELSHSSKSEVRAKILDKQRFSREPALKVTLFQGIPKHGKMESIIQKSVELGASSIVPVIMARTVPAGKDGFLKKTERWQKVSSEAVKQCRRGVVPKVAPAAAFSEMAEVIGTGKFDAAVFPYENEEECTIKDALRGLEGKPGSLALAIGPEGGFSDEEAALLKEAGALPVSLGKTILRTETAGPAAIAMVMYELEL